VPDPALTIDELVVRYGATTAVAGLSLTAQSGKVTALIGPNGAGKTSTVEACVGLREPASGMITMLQDTVTAGDRGGLRDRVGVMLQDGGLYSTAAPLEFVRYVASLYPRADDPRQLLADLGLDPDVRTPIRRLSGGEQQRVKCAAALVGRPELVFLDEPTAGLDPLARRGFHDLVRGLTDRGTTVILTTHLMDDVERLADHVVVMARGRVVRSGTVSELVGEDDSITFRGPLHIDLSDLRSALPAECTISEDHPGHYRVAGSADPMVLSAIASWSAQHGSTTADLSIGRRSLEDVVVELIGERP
jgi:ABC-2 type transport system ATP-binding protein